MFSIFLVYYILSSRYKAVSKYRYLQHDTWLTAMWKSFWDTKIYSGKEYKVNVVEGKKNSMQEILRLQKQEFSDGVSCYEGFYSVTWVIVKKTLCPLIVIQFVEYTYI